MARVFLSTFEKPLDAKRRFVVPQDFRAAATSLTGAPEGVFCFPSMEADCIEGGGQALFDRYQALIESYPFGSPERSAFETEVFGGMHRLSFDSAGRITLPDSLCEQFGLTDKVVVVGLNSRFQIWSPEVYATWRVKQRDMARQALRALSTVPVTGGAA